MKNRCIHCVRFLERRILTAGLCCHPWYRPIWRNAPNYFRHRIERRFSDVQARAAFRQRGNDSATDARLRAAEDRGFVAAAVFLVRETG